ncbi:hypothetical protein BDF14DRAFT_100405 [Spinellus fusiger]|nr:hypothetical protein BDF14DRAFT_100405 [Spinellus fusiger]
MPAAGHTLQNPLLNSVMGLQDNTNIKGSIPYLAKMVQWVENQSITKVVDADEAQRSLYQKQTLQLSLLKADAHAQLADAFFKAKNHVQCEASLTFSIKIWERLMKQKESPQEIPLLLSNAYDQLKECYEVLGKTSMACHIETRKIKLLAS